VFKFRKRDNSVMAVDCNFSRQHAINPCVLVCYAAHLFKRALYHLKSNQPSSLSTTSSQWRGQHNQPQRHGALGYELLYLITKQSESIRGKESTAGRWQAELPCLPLLLALRGPHVLLRWGWRQDVEAART